MIGCRFWQTQPGYSAGRVHSVRAALGQTNDGAPGVTRPAAAPNPHPLLITPGFSKSFTSFFLRAKNADARLTPILHLTKQKI
jgi:hypothetical protein